MRSFFHHVGDVGANRDFPRTIFKSKSITEIADAIPNDNPAKYHLISQLTASFPNGEANCWGVPRGAKRVINSLQTSDLVLFVKSLHIPGEIPAMCIVNVFEKIELPKLSIALWGEDKFPYIFFFKTEKINLTWMEFIEYLNYRHNYDPRGTFCFIAENKLKRWGGSSGFHDYLIKKHFVADNPQINVSLLNEPSP